MQTQKKSAFNIQHYAGTGKLMFNIELTGAEWAHMCQWNMPSLGLMTACWLFCTIMPWIGVHHGEMDVIQWTCFFNITSWRINSWKGANQLKELFFLDLIFLKYILEIDKS